MAAFSGGIVHLIIAECHPISLDKERAQVPAPTPAAPNERHPL
jgi:hypothetical protein